MTTISRCFGITSTLPFEDLHVDRDNRLYIDPYAIRLGVGPTQFATAANKCTQTFFNEVTRCVLSTAPADHSRGLRLLQQFEEPKETRLGMSRRGFNGHGGRDGIGQEFWDTLTGSAEALVELGVLKHLEHAPLFVHRVGNDITSDLTTRVIYGPLANFTQKMVEQFPELARGSGLITTDRQVWDCQRLRWTTQTFHLPSAHSAPLILVPRGWARHELLLNAGRFYETTVLSHEQLQRAKQTTDGKLLTTPKDRLRRQTDLRPGYETLVRVVREAFGKHHTDLVEQFEAFALHRYQPTSPEQLARRIG